MVITYKAGRRVQGLSTDNATTTETITATGTYAVDFPVGSYDNDKQGFYVANTSSAVYGKTINSVSFWLKRGSSTTGTAYVRVWSDSGSGNTGTQAHEFGSIALSALTTSYVKHTFSTGSHTLAVNDTVGVEFSGGSSLTSPVLQGATTDVYDGVNTIRNRNTTGGTFSPVTTHDVKFEVTVGQSKPTNVQVGSRFEETDTRKMYHKTDEYKVHSFTTTGTSTFAVTGSGNVEYLVVGGGGGGGYHGAGNSGGGGAGGYRTGTGLGVTAQNYTITVGAGGAVLAKGNDSIFDTITSTGGGAGAIVNISSATINDGGSGGGAGQNVNGAGGQGNTPSTTPRQGFNGGAGSGSPNYGGNGGGGAGAVGGSNSGTNGRIGGNGGDGLSSSITGSAVYYAGGGAGSSHNQSTEGQPQGGQGGGGNGSKSGAVNTAGAANTGGGGGGAGDGDGTTGAAVGGSGIVIIRYKTSSGITATGGTITTISSVWSEEGT